MSDEHGEIKVHRDTIAEKLDEVADLSECWKKNRDKGHAPSGIRFGLLHLVAEIDFLVKQESDLLMSDTKTVYRDPELFR